MLRVYVLGELALELDGAPLEPPASRRARSLLGLLAVEHRIHARSELAARFWPDVLDESARTSLRGVLSALRRSLGGDADGYLVATREQAGLAPEVWTDAGEFERLAAAGELEQAMQLWRGDLLSGLDDDWVLSARDEWRRRAADVLARLASAAESQGDLAAAVGHTRRMVALDPLAEEGQRELIRRLAAIGDRAAALAAYHRYADRLRAQLQIAPSPATRALAEELRRSEPESVASGPAQPPRAEPAAAPSGAVRPAPAAGTVTLLFTDLVGSTELLAQLGDEEAERLRRTHFALLRDVALSHAGYEVKNLGDGLMVVFGSSVDAARCAIGIQQAIDRHNRREGDGRLRVRVGLHVGEPIRDEDDYFGTPVVVAKRLCDQSGAGQILCSDLVRSLLGTRGGFTFGPVGELALKGISQPVAACELAWEPADEKRIPLPAELDRAEAPLVGRQRELRALEEVWRGVREGRSQVMLVAGDPGIGKTRLVAELCRGAHAEGAMVLLGRCYEEALVPYQPFVEALSHYVASCPPDELRLQLGTRRPALAKLVPDLVGIEQVASSRSAEPESERYAMFDAVATVLREGAYTHPTILVLDDLHWADPPSLLLLRHVARRAGDAPLLILGTYRETEVHESEPLAAALAELRRARTLTALPLGGLGDDDVAALVRDRGVELEDDFVRAVAERTEGNPFFVEEFVRHLEVGGELGVPQSVKDVILRRLRRFAEAERRMLAAAAVIGRQFEFDVLVRVTGVGEEELLEALDKAVAERVLVEAPDEVGQYGFAHALIREAIYEQLSSTRRAWLHLRVGEAIAAGRGGRLDEHAAALAHHFARAGADARSFEYQCGAARNAVRVHALETALGHFDDALRTGARLGLSAESDESMRRLLLERGWVRYIVGDLEAGLADYGAALAAARAARDRRLEMEGLDLTAFLHKAFDVRRAIAQYGDAQRIAEDLGDVAAQVRILSRLSLCHSNELDLSAALEVGERALDLAREKGDERDRALAIDALKLAALQLGDLDRLAELTGELEEIERRHGDLWYLQWTLLESTFVSIARARWDEAAARLEEALAINRRIGDALSRPLLHDATGWLERSRGAYDRALTAGRRAVELTRQEGRSTWASWTRATLAWTLLDVRAGQAAAEVLRCGLEHARMRADELRCAGHLAWALALVGDRTGSADAAARAEQALTRLRAPAGTTFLFGYGAIVALARAYLAAGEPDRAKRLLDPLRRSAERSAWHEAVASASLVIGLCREARGEPDAARSELRRALELASRHGLPAVEWEAQHVLARFASGSEADSLRAQSGELVERLAASVGDEQFASTLTGAAQS